VEGANVRSEPQAAGNVVGNVFQGDELVLLDVSGEWFLVQPGDQISPATTFRSGQGWILRTLVTPPPQELPVLNPS
jgi:hypothetical protein